MKNIFLFCILIYSTSALSSGTWYGPFTIKKIQRYWDGKGRTAVYINETINTGCQKTDSDSMATYYFSNNENYHGHFFSGAMSAQAQRKKIRLLLDYSCHATYGLNIHGIEIITD